MLFLFFFVQLIPSFYPKWSHIFSCEVQVILFSFGFIWCHSDLVDKFCLDGHRILDEIKVCCFCLILLFVLTRFFNDGRSHQSDAAISNHWIICFAGNFFLLAPFLEKTIGYSGVSDLFHIWYTTMQKLWMSRMEHYVRSNITEPPCLFLYISLIVLFQDFIIFTPIIDKRFGQLKNKKNFSIFCRPKSRFLNGKTR